jgi:hypothetical protein
MCIFDSLKNEYLVGRSAATTLAIRSASGSSPFYKKISGIFPAALFNSKGQSQGGGEKCRRVNNA